MWKHIYFINIFVLFICIFTRVTVHFLVANDKNRNQTTLRKIVGFICSLTGKFKNGTGLTPMYTTRLSLLSLHFHALSLLVSLYCPYSPMLYTKFLPTIRKMLMGQSTLYLTVTNSEEKEQKVPAFMC